METYRHTQKGTVIRAGLMAGFATVLGVQISAGWNLIAILVMVILGICLLIFSSLTVIIAEGSVICYFGQVRMIRKRMALADIEQVQAVRNSWLAGWGIRFLTNGSTLWNVSGLDAVEITLKSNKRFRIGTDEPQALVQALQSARQL